MDPGRESGDVKSNPDSSRRPSGREQLATPENEEFATLVSHATPEQLTRRCPGSLGICGGRSRRSSFSGIGTVPAGDATRENDRLCSDFFGKDFSTIDFPRIGRGVSAEFRFVAGKDFSPLVGSCWDGSSRAVKLRAERATMKSAVAVAG